eukprot:TRINITY_DN4913_c0_g1_i1.p1 TRINITY_DN4913_c0_g1~~TRINITY_DN4913_c0_g1_i1.p1  ORF type:complete len:502 (+),score=257.79 TRINITY_DN4913_c0_g1_i1:181-1506(+)
MASSISIKSFLQDDIRRFSLPHPSSVALVESLRNIYQLPQEQALRVRIVRTDGSEKDLEYGDLSSLFVSDLVRVRVSLDASPSPLVKAPLSSAKSVKEARKQLKLLRKEQRLSERLIETKTKCMGQLHASSSSSFCSKSFKPLKPNYFHISETLSETSELELYRPMQVIQKMITVKNCHRLTPGTRCFLQQFHCTAPNSLCNFAPYSIACFTPEHTTLVPITLVMPSSCGSFKYSFRLISDKGERISNRLVIRTNVVRNVPRAKETQEHLVSLGFEDRVLNANAIGKADGDRCLATQFIVLKTLKTALRVSPDAEIEPEPSKIAEARSRGSFSSSSNSNGGTRTIVPAPKPVSVEQCVDLKLQSKYDRVNRAVERARFLLDELNQNMINRGVAADQVQASREYIFAAINKSYAKQMKKLEKMRARMIRKNLKRLKRSFYME